MDQYNDISTGATKVNPLPKKYVALTRDNYEVGVFSLPISLFVRFLANYLLIVVDNPQTDAFKAVQSKMMKLWV